MLSAYEANTLPAEPTFSAYVLFFKRDFNWIVPRLFVLTQVIALALLKKKKRVDCHSLFIYLLFIFK